MNKYKYILFLIAALALAGCGAKKKAVSTLPSAAAGKAAPAWHTCLIQGARATVKTDGTKLSASITMQTVRDSMIVMSVMPLLGMEMLRVEATPLEVLVIDKIHGQYGKATYAEINRKLTPAVNWDVLQQIASAELPTGNERARMVYNFGKQVIEVVIDYPARKTDVPVRVSAQRIDRYTQVDISKWL